MKVTFLGTGTSQGVPVIGCDCAVCLSKDPRDKRLRTSALVQVNDLNLALDVGPDFRQQMLSNQVRSLDAIIITHEHNDHIIGMDDVRPFNFRFNKDMPIYCTPRVRQALKQRFEYAFVDNPYPGAPRFELHMIQAGEAFSIEENPVMPIEVMHGKMPVLGFRIKDFTYLTDVKTVSEKSLEMIKGTKVLVVSALRKKEHHSHFNLDEALAFVKKVNPQQTYLIHISHMMGLYEEVNNSLPEGVTLAYDGLTVEV